MLKELRGKWVGVEFERVDAPTATDSMRLATAVLGCSRVEQEGNAEAEAAEAEVWLVHSTARTATVATAANNSARKNPEGLVLASNREPREMEMRTLTLLVGRRASSHTNRRQL